MKETCSIMGMPITVHVADESATTGTIAEIFAYFKNVDEIFSTYKNDSEISLINRGEILESDFSSEMREVLALSEMTKYDTDGFFDILRNDGTLDPSGIVKGWAIRNAAALLKGHAFNDFYIEAGGDIEARGLNEERMPWRIGIRDPFTPEDQEKVIVKVLQISDRGIATSGNYIRGGHIYDPLTGNVPFGELVSISVIGPDVYDADRYATAAFAMGTQGIHFIEGLKRFEGYAIDAQGQATMTSGFQKFVI